MDKFSYCRFAYLLEWINANVTQLTHLCCIRPRIGRKPRSIALITTELSKATPLSLIWCQKSRGVLRLRFGFRECFFGNGDHFWCLKGINASWCLMNNTQSRTDSNVEQKNKFQVQKTISYVCLQCYKIRESFCRIHLVIRLMYQIVLIILRLLW